jgi:BirA family biotin operon repressor/biotin-[acetyl-CoA-carboxylase] ligase
MTDLSASAIERQVKRRYSGDVEVQVLERIGSTNNWVKDKTASATPAIGQVLVCAAEQQTAGRGRRGKTWHSPDRGVTFTTAFTLPLQASDLAGLSLLCGAAICTVLRDYGVVEARVKWPNDILVDGAKLCGILIEVVGATKGSSTVIVGIGLNYHRGDEISLIDQQSTDLFTLTGHPLPDRSLLIADLVGELLTRCNSDVPSEVVKLSAQWHQFDALQQQLITCDDSGTHHVSGRGVGIDKTGRLLIDTASGIVAVSAGSIRVIHSE